MRTLRGRAVVLVHRGRGGRSVGSIGVPAAHAASWDPRVEPIAREVEKLRGLEFEHPVPVDFLSDAAFNKSIAVNREQAVGRRQGPTPARAVAAALDRAPPRRRRPDRRDSRRCRRRARSPSTTRTTKRATVRGKKIDVATKVTLAHELTHALQDQHFDLSKLQQAADAQSLVGRAAGRWSKATRARVQLLYADQLSNAEREQYEQFQSSGSDQALAETRAQGVPDSLSVLFQSPYTLGPLDARGRGGGQRQDRRSTACSATRRRPTRRSSRRRRWSTAASSRRSRRPS